MAGARGTWDGNFKGGVDELEGAVGEMSETKLLREQIADRVEGSAIHALLVDKMLRERKEAFVQLRAGGVAEAKRAAGAGDTGQGVGLSTRWVRVGSSNSRRRASESGPSTR